MTLLSRQRVIWSIALLSFLSWCASLALPALTLGTFSVPGWQFLVHGWKGLAALSIGGVSWLANPLLVLAWLSLATPKYAQLAAICAGLAALAALTSFLFNMLGGGGEELLISGYDIGFYLWLMGPLLQSVAGTLYYLHWRRFKNGALSEYGTLVQ